MPGKHRWAISHSGLTRSLWGRRLSYTLARLAPDWPRLGAPQPQLHEWPPRWAARVLGQPWPEGLVNPFQKEQQNVVMLQQETQRTEKRPCWLPIAG